MKCPKCQTENINEARFCEKCGAKLEEAVEATSIVGDGVVAEKVQAEVQNTSAPSVSTEPQTTAATSATENEHKGEKLDFLTTIKQVFMKPGTMLRENLPKYNSAKPAGLIALIALVSSVVIDIIITLISSVFTFRCRSGSSGCEFKFSTDSLEYIKFGKLIFNDFVSTLVVMLVVVGVFYGIAQLFKYKKASFWKLLAIVSIVMFPMMLMKFLGAIVGIFNVVWSSVVVLAGVLYAAIVFYEGVVQESQAEGDRKIQYIFLSAVATIIAIIIVAWLIGDKIGLTGLSSFLG